MKSIELKEAKEMIPVMTQSGIEYHEREFKTRDLIKDIIDTTPKEGLTVSEMIFRYKMSALLGEANGELKIEDADYEKLSALIKPTHWMFRAKFIIEFVNQF